MQTEAIKTAEQIPENLNKKETLKFKFSLDGNLGMQMALMSGLGGILYYLFSCTCPT